MSKIKHTFKKTGITVEVDTLEQLQTIAKSLGETVTIEKTYNSSTHGLVLIADMASWHIMNALRKRAGEVLDAAMVAAKEASGCNQSLHAFMKGYMNLADDALIVDLLTEMDKRLKADMLGG